MSVQIFCQIERSQNKRKIYRELHLDTNSFHEFTRCDKT